VIPRALAWKLAFDQAPAMVALPGNANEVAEVVQLAADSGLRVAVHPLRGGRLGQPASTSSE